MSLAKQNFSAQSEEALNQQVNTELQASQVYLSMSAWAQHTSVALPGKIIKYSRKKAFV
jgi:ferritin heavy chain